MRQCRTNKQNSFQETFQKWKKRWKCAVASGWDFFEGIVCKNDVSYLITQVATFLYCQRNTVGQYTTT